MNDPLGESARLLLLSRFSLLPQANNHDSGASHLPHAQFESPHSDEILSDFGETLLGLMDEILGPVLKLLIDLGEGLRVALMQFDLLPELGWGVCTLNGLDAEVSDACSTMSVTENSVRQHVTKQRKKTTSSKRGRSRRSLESGRSSSTCKQRDKRDSRRP